MVSDGSTWCAISNNFLLGHSRAARDVRYPTFRGARGETVRSAGCRPAPTRKAVLDGQRHRPTDHDAGVRNRPSSHLARRRAGGGSARYPVDRVVFGVAAAITVAFIAWGVFATDNLSAVAKAVLGGIITGGGWAFVLAASGFVVFAVWLAVSRYGRIPLGRDDEAPEFRTSSTRSRRTSKAVDVANGATLPGHSRRLQRRLGGSTVAARRGLRLASSSRGLRGLLSTAACTARRSWRPQRDRSVPLGTCCRIRTLTIWFMPRRRVSAGPRSRRRCRCRPRPAPARTDLADGPGQRPQQLGGQRTQRVVRASFVAMAR